MRNCSNCKHARKCTESGSVVICQNKESPKFSQPRLYFFECKEWDFEHNEDKQGEPV